VNIIRCTKVRHHQWIRSKGRDDKTPVPRWRRFWCMLRTPRWHL